MHKRREKKNAKLFKINKNKKRLELNRIIQYNNSVVNRAIAKR